MSPETRCEQVRELAPELALGIASGEERAVAIQHLAVCLDCRRQVSELAELADRLLDLAPVKEPPVGFEARVIERIRGRRPGFRRRLLTAAVVAVLAAGIAGAGMYVATGPERRVAAHYRETLARADGTYFGAVALRAPDGRQAGLLFAYEGSPSWIFVILEEAPVAPHDLEVVTRIGMRSVVGSLRQGSGTWGGTLPVALREVAAFRIVNRESGDTVAEFRARDESSRRR